MRISVEVDEPTLKQVIAYTGEKGKGPALSMAVKEFVRRRKAQEFGRLIREGAFDYYGEEDGEAPTDDFLDPIPPLQAD